jgi:GTP-binding protein
VKSIPSETALSLPETGTSIAYAIDKLQDRGTFLFCPENRLQGEVIGEHIRRATWSLTCVKPKTHQHAASDPTKKQYRPARRFSLEQYMEYMGMTIPGSNS